MYLLFNEIWLKIHWFHGFSIELTICWSLWLNLPIFDQFLNFSHHFNQFCCHDSDSDSKFRLDFTIKVWLDYDLVKNFRPRWFNHLSFVGPETERYGNQIPMNPKSRYPLCMFVCQFLWLNGHSCCVTSWLLVLVVVLY